MNIYYPGQRWISETEPELGLGLILEVSNRTIQVLFHAADETRQYAINTAPLKRVRFEVGDEVSSRNGDRLTVDSVIEDEHSGTLSYIDAEGKKLNETDLCDTSNFDQPETRLLGGHVDENALFELRSSVLQARHRYGKLPVRGLMGGRVDLIAHQLYIAKEVSERPLPRILLADEVGLGKTIEACLILHRLLVCGIIKRVFIVVPNPLVHQWFVELFRRFNLTFSIYNEKYCQAIEAEEETNPFHDNQLILTSIEFLTEHPERSEQAITADWDLLIVDEAHHLHWSQEETSPEYDIIARLAGSIPRLLLLTASPEQMGLESHYARLKLLDPKRYPSFKDYQEEHDQYATVANELEKQIDSMDAEELAETLDRHGPGRVIFRNTRKCVKGFPKRHPHLIALDSPNKATLPDPNDPRITWLINFITANPTKKILIITRTHPEVSAIVDAVKSKSSAKVAHFHEGMQLIQCDRQAAWFAEPEGARIMVVSEIGGEGRNFQVASDLVLIDLPRDPELLEQRIGRLDRIGQQNEIHIHIPYVKGSAEEQLLRWLHEGLNAFAEPVIGGFQLLERFESELHDVNDLVIKKTASYSKKLKKQITAGRDRLLELSSFRPKIGTEIAQQIETCEQAMDLKPYLLELFEQYGVHAEPLDDTTYHIHPDQLFDDWFPLSAEGFRITFSRKEALIRPDAVLMSWDHPMVTGAAELILGSERGSCAIAIDPSQACPLKLQAIFVLEVVASPTLNADQFLPPTPITVTVDHTCQTIEEAIPAALKDSEPWKILEHETLRQQLIPSMVKATRPHAEEEAQEIIIDARKQMRETLGKEYKRLKYLSEVNNNIRKQELRHTQKKITKLDKKLAEARLRLDAVRLICAG